MTKIIGHEWAVELLAHQQKNNRMPQSLLLVGPPNVGKGTLARFFMQRLNCQQEDKPCNQCLSCRKIASGNHPDMFIFDREDETLKIDTVRELQRTLSLSPVEGRYRVAVLCNFERATISAANALLKTLEEPPPDVVIILTASDRGMLLSTIVSRCQVITLRPLPNSVVVMALQTHWQVSSEKTKLLAQLAAGRLGWAIRALNDEELLTRRDQSLQDLLHLLSTNRVERLDYAHKLSLDIAMLKEALIFWVTLSRDLLLLQSQCQTPIINLDWQDKLRPIADRLTISQVKGMVVRLRNALTNLDRNVNPRLNVEVTLLKLPYLGTQKL